MLIKVQVNDGEVTCTESLKRHVEEQVEHALRHLEDRFTRVEAHLHDDNAGKGGPGDKRCVLEARPKNADPLAVEDSGDDMAQTVTATARKLERAAKRWAERRTTR